MAQTPFCSVVQPKEKVLVVMGTAGTGKSRLAIKFATSYDGEIIYADKMKAYKGLDIVTNKITEEQCCGVPQHLLGILEDPETDFNAENFVISASDAMKSVIKNGKLPIITGGSISFIEALIDDHSFRSSYEACFIWLDVQLPVLKKVLYDRVDRMVAAGMVEEVKSMYNPDADYTKGIRRAIGVPELDSYFRAENSSSAARKVLLESAINEVKINTFKRAQRQVKKIYRLRDEKGW
ncbi:adenylate isopentenyltransferase 3, chloroplastic-like [Bidens hawaiensis]|uniref:adenylate isopentenyltransferase 3, chloroplastic-like n=1 Tax=Bidens hawaiensis TaxID=980011 RepID=UPI0040490332